MVHDLSYRYFPSAYSRSFRLAYGALLPSVMSRSATVFTVSEAERRSIRALHPRLDERRLVAVQNGGGEGAHEATVSDDDHALVPGTSALPSRAARGRRLLYVGSLTRRKNAAGLLDAAVQLARRHDAEVTFVGSTGGSFEQLGLQVPDDVAGRLHFLGQVNSARVIEGHYRRSAALLFPSFYEASPLPPVEAMRFGCPVVAADIPSLRERCGPAAVYCDPHDVGSIVGAASDLLDVEALWSLQQKRGLDRAAGFSWEAQVRAVMAHVVSPAAGSTRLPW